MTRENRTYEEGWVEGYLFGQRQTKFECLDAETQKLIILSVLDEIKDGHSDPAEQIALRLAEADDIATEIFAAEEEIRQAERVYHETRYLAIESRDTARGNCEHWATKPTESPKNSKFHVCLICGEEVRSERVD